MTFDPYFDDFPAPAVAAQGAPRYMHDLVDRAAAILGARWPATVGHFSLWADGEERQYVARMEWPHDELGVRVLVFDGRSGDFVCRSLLTGDVLAELDGDERPSLSDLVDHAARRLRAVWPSSSASFTWPVHGEGREYLARLCWSPGVPGPCLAVIDSSTCDPVCSSMAVGDELTTLDLSFLDTTAYPHDLVDKQLHEERQAGRG